MNKYKAVKFVQISQWGILINTRGWLLGVDVCLWQAVAKHTQGESCGELNPPLANMGSPSVRELLVEGRREYSPKHGKNINVS